VLLPIVRIAFVQEQSRPQTIELECRIGTARVSKKFFYFLRVSSRFSTHSCQNLKEIEMAKRLALFTMMWICSRATVAWTAEQAAPVDPAAFSSYVAQVVKIADGALTIHTFRGHSGMVETLNPSEDTVVVLSGKPAKLADLKPDQWIRLHWNYGADKKTIKVIKIEDSAPPPMMQKQ
jgi:hypothetical protein